MVPPFFPVVTPLFNMRKKIRKINYFQVAKNACDQSVILRDTLHWFLAVKLKWKEGGERGRNYFQVATNVCD